MSLLAPALLVGLLALGLPIAAHLLGKHTPKVIDFGAMRFLTPNEPVVRSRKRFRDVPLLLARLALFALLVFALSQPVGNSERNVRVLAGAHDAVVLLDGSLSMQLRSDGHRAIDRAIELAQEILEAVPQGSRVGLVTSDPWGPTIELSPDSDAVARAIAEWVEQSEPMTPSFSGQRLVDALPKALAVLGPAQAERPAAIYAISDRTPRGLGSLQGSIPANIGLISLATDSDNPDESEAKPLPEHIQLEDIQWEPAEQIDPRAIRIVATVRRHGGNEGTIHRAQLMLSVGSETTPGEVELKPDQSSQVEFVHMLVGSESSVPASITIRQSDDPLPGDDTRHFWLSSQAQLDVTIVNGDPSDLRAHDEVFFLTAALRSSEKSRVTIRTLAPEQLDERVQEDGESVLARIDLLILANTAAPNEYTAKAIEQAVGEGMGLWITMGDRIVADHYNKRLHALLPLLLRGANEAGTAPGRASARSEQFATPDRSHPIFRQLGEDLALTEANTRKRILVQPDPQRQPEVAIAFSTGAPALLTREFKSGRVGLLTTSIDRDWTDAPLHPGYVAMVQLTTQYLGGVRGGSVDQTITVGDSVTFQSTQPVQIVGPKGYTELLAPDGEGNVTFDQTHTPGHYAVTVDPNQDARRVFAVQVNPLESQVERSVVMPASESSNDEQASIRINPPRYRILIWLAALLLAIESMLRWRARKKVTVNIISYSPDK